MGPRQYVVDSSVFVAFYSGADVNHSLALRFFSEVNEAILVVHPYVIQETASVLCYKYGYEAAVPFLDHVLKATNIIIPSVNLTNEIAGFLVLRKKISFTDTALIQLAKRLHAELVTFDKQMISLAKRS